MANPTDKPIKTTAEAYRMAKLGATLEGVPVRLYVEAAISDRLKANHPRSHRDAVEAKK